MSYKEVNRNVVKTRDIILHDGEAYDQFKDPFKQIARTLWEDIQQYETIGSPNHNMGHLKMKIDNLY
jgi:hypothetical protein